MRKLKLLVLCLCLSIIACKKENEKKVLRVGTNHTYKPFEFSDENGELVGFEVDIVKAVMNKLGYQYENVDMKFSGLIIAINENKIDVIASGMSVTDERKDKVNFTEPYYVGGVSILTKINNNEIDEINSFDDLQGKRIGVGIGTKNADIAKLIQDADVIEYETASDSFLALDTNKVDAVIGGKATNSYYVATAGKGKVKNIDTDLGEQDEMAMATAKDNPQLAEQISKAIAELKESGEYQKIYDKWFGGE